MNHQHLICQVCYAQIPLEPDHLYQAHLRWHRTLSNIPTEAVMPKPAIGRIVHYRSFGTPKGEFESTCRAAVVTAVGEDPAVIDLLGDSPQVIVSLCAINPTGLFFHETCPQDETNTQGGTWHWPERVE